MNIISSSVETNEYKLLNVRSLDFIYAFMKLKILDYLGFQKYLEETGYDFLDLEFINKYHELELYITIKNFDNNIKPLKELKELQLLREQKINEIKKGTKIKLNLLNDEMNDILEDLEFELKRGTLKNRYFTKLNSHEDEIKLRLAAKEEINETERLKEEVTNNKDTLSSIDNEILKLLTVLKYEEEDILHDTMTSESELTRLGIPPIQIDNIKNSILPFWK